MILLNPKEFCGDCRNTIFDLFLECSEVSVGCKRRAPGDCNCTCIEMGAGVCPTFRRIEKCACMDGSVEAYGIVSGVWIGVAIPEVFAAIAAHFCPDDPHYLVYLWGSRYDFTSHTTTTNLACPVTTDDWDTITLDGFFPQTDWMGGPIIREDDGTCIGGAFFLSPDDVGIRRADKPEESPEDSESCSFEGGCAALMFQVVLSCDPTKQLVLCPFSGFIGVGFECEIPPDFCENWNVTHEQSECEITLTLVHIEGECTVTVTLTIGDEIPITINLGDGTTQIYVRTIVPCPGGTLVIRVGRIWNPECTHGCDRDNGEVIYTFDA